MIVASFPDSILQFRGSLIEALQANRFIVHVAVPDVLPGSELHGVLTDRKVVVHQVTMRRAGTSPMGDVRTLLSLWKLMLSVRPDMVLAYTIKPVIYGSLAAWASRVPHRFALITGLGYAFQGGATRSWLRGIVQRLYRVALMSVHKVFFQNPDDQALFRKLGILGSQAYSVVVNGSGVDVAGFKRRPLPASGPVYLMIGRLLGDKGVREYAEAAQRVRSMHSESRFGLVGWIDENPDAIAQDELEAWVASGSVEFYGKLADVRPLIEACTVYVLPSYREGTPRTVLEAMATGRAIITTDAPGCRETVIDGVNGFLVPVQSVDALVDAMLKFIDDPFLAQRMGLRSRLIAEDKYDVHKVNAVMLREMGISTSSGTPGTMT